MRLTEQSLEWYPNHLLGLTMKSPRFDIRANILKDIFSSNNIKDVWTKKVRIFMRQQFMNDGIENFDFHTFRDIECAKLSKTILSGNYVPQRATRILVEKSKGLCRQIVIPTIRDAIVLQCLSDSLYPHIKKKAPSKNSFFEPKEHKFGSQRDSYGTFASWIKFQKTLFSFSKERNFIVVTDISNYYDTINYIHLRNTLSPISGASECILDMLIYVLSDLLWQPDYMPRTEIGLPQINLDAPRVLAHCFLYELDSFLAEDKSIDFVRFMDDIDIGVDNIVKAKHVLKDIDLVLQTKHVRLNSGKTRILSRIEAAKHFRIKDNIQLDMLSSRIDKKLSTKSNISRETNFLKKKIHRGINSSYFDDGNGDKILKRLLTMASKTNTIINNNVIENIIRLRPNCRENALSYIRALPLTPNRINIVTKSISSGMFVDDASIVDTANYIVETHAPNPWKLGSHLDKIISYINSGSFFGFYSAVWISSKYKPIDFLFEKIDDRRHIWMPDERLSRIVASFWPLFQKTELEAPYINIINFSNNNGAMDVIRFHNALSSDPKVFKLMFDSLKNPNPSRGTGITHAKFLCLLSALLNDNASATQKKTLIDANKIALSDSYYRKIAKRLSIV